jgi:branched-chain amino acid transport system ATP-binding protein
VRSKYCGKKDVLEIRALNKSYGALHVTRDVSFDVPAGARYGIVGPNGSGKTTLFNLLTGEVHPDSGEILLDGRSITRTGPDVRARLGLARSFQKNNLFTRFTVAENLAAALSVRLGISANIWHRLSRYDELKMEIRQLAEQLGLTGVLNSPAGTLPYGTQRQLELGLALAISPRILLLDEPTAGMSAEETVVMTKLIAELPRQTALVIVEHDMAVLFEIAERIIVLDYGQILIQGTPLEVRQSDIVRQRYLGRGNRDA